MLTPSGTFQGFLAPQSLQAGVGDLSAALTTNDAQGAARMGGSSVDAVLAEAMRHSYEAMVVFSQREDAAAQMAVVFGSGYDVAAADQFFDSLVMGPGMLPQVEVLDDSILGGALGAYAQATDTVYMSRQFLESGNVDAITGVLIEEFGHGIDARVNAIDSPGDEGHIFSMLVVGQSLENMKLESLKMEDDSTVIFSEGVSFVVEQSQGLIWHDQDSGQVDVWTVENDQKTASHTLHPGLRPEWNIEASADFDQDGETDLVWRNENSGEVDIWFIKDLDGSRSFHSLNIATIRDTNWKISGAGDLNGDGLTDLVWRDSRSGRVDAWLATKSSRNEYLWNSKVVHTVKSSDWNIEAVSDFNSDGKSDLVWRDSSTGRVDIWKMNGSSWSNQTIANSVHTDWSIEAASDLTGDGYSDLVWRNHKTGEVDLWKMRGMTKLSSNSLDRVGNTNWRIVGSFNSDNWENPIPDLAYYISDEYGTPPSPNRDWHHKGIDLATYGKSPIIESVKSGTVVFAGWNTQGYGNLVIVDHGNGFRSYYAHMSEISVRVDEKVTNDTILGKVGSTGNSTGAHLHFEIRKDGNPVDPREYINF